MHEVHSRRHLLPDGLVRDVQVGHGHHRVEPVQRVARAVRVDRGQTAVVAGVHGLEHVERFFAADLADDNAIGTHTEGVDHELPLADGALAFDVRRPRLEPHHVPLPQHQLGGVLDGHDSLVARDEARQDVEQRRLAGAGSARHDDVEPRGDGAAQEVEHRLRQRFAVDQVVGAEAIRAKTPDRHRGAVERQRGNDRVDARAVLQTRVHHRRRFVNAPADGADDALDDLHQVLVVAEDDVGLLDAAFALDEHLRRAVHQDVGDRRILQQHFEGAEPEHLVQHVLHDVLAVVEAQRNALILLVEELLDDAADLGLCLRARHLRQPLEVQPCEQVLVNPPLQGLVLRVANVCVADANGVI